MPNAFRQSPLNRPLVALLVTLAWMGLIFGLSHRQTLPTPRGLSAQFTSVAGHFTVYLVLAVLLYWTLALVMSDTGWRYLTAWGLAVLYGVSDEWHQSFVPGRVPDVLDILTDAVGAAVGLLIVWWLRRQFFSAPSDAESPR